MPLILLSPAKTMDFSNVANDSKEGVKSEWNCVEHLSETKLLINELRPKKTAALKTLLGGVSDNIASLNQSRFQLLEATPLKKKDLVPIEGERRGGGFAYDGPAYKGLAMGSLDTTAQTYLQKNLRILSGLYGTVRPKDLIQPYRLCMGTKLAVEATETKNLYDFWKTKQLTQTLAKEFTSKDGTLVINCASQEYSSVIDRKSLPDSFTWVDCAFKDSGRVLSFFAKRARGMMCRFCAENQVETIEELKKFNMEGYKFVKGESTETTLVFGRVKPPPASAAKKKKAEPTKSLLKNVKKEVDSKQTKAPTNPNTKTVKKQATVGKTTKRKKATTVKAECNDGDDGDDGDGDVKVEVEKTKPKKKPKLEEEIPTRRSTRNK